MSWFYECFVKKSEQNGTIMCRRVFGSWFVTVNGCYETAPYTINMWKKALAKLPSDFRPRRILMFGLGGGGNLPLLNTKFPQSEITVIEWDPGMVEIARHIGWLSPHHPTRVVVADAEQAVHALEGTFDLVLYDLFQGKDTAHVGFNSVFLQTLQKKFAMNGLLMVNAFCKPELFARFDQFFTRLRSWKYLANQLAMYDAVLPDGYTNVREEAALMLRTAAGDTRFSCMEQPGLCGMRWHVGPFWCERYFSDREPQILSGSSRVLIWQPLLRLDKPRGWHRSFARITPAMTGFAEITSPSAYWETWTSHAKRHRKEWLLEQTKFIIEDVSLATFMDAYHQAKLFSEGSRVSMDGVPAHVRGQESLAHFFLARDKETGVPVAGLAVLDVPEAHQSMHLASFMDASVAQTSVGTGLVDEWFQASITRGIRFLDFGLFYAAGDPKEWEGFSHFKSQFGVRFIRYPKPLVRWVRGRSVDNTAGPSQPPSSR